MVGTLGDASFFSFQAFKPLNTYGGGLAWMRDADLARRVGEFADGEAVAEREARREHPVERQVAAHVHPAEGVHLLAVPDLVCRVVGRTRSRRSASGKACARSTRCPTHYRGRFTNVQAAIGLAGLKRLPEFIERTRRHARMLDDLLGDVPGITIPQTPPGRTHVYYQYCAYVPDSETIVKRCIRRGVDVAPMHVDVCTRMELFDWKGRAGAAARSKAATAVQVPVYESLSDAEIERVGRLVREQVKRLRRTDARRGDRVTLPPALAAKRPSGAEVPAAGASASMSGR